MPYCPEVPENSTIREDGSGDDGLIEEKTDAEKVAPVFLSAADAMEPSARASEHGNNALEAEKREAKETVNSPEVAWKQRLMGEAGRLKNKYINIAKVKELIVGVDKAMVIFVPGLLLGGGIGTVMAPSFAPIIAAQMAKLLIENMAETKSDSNLGSVVVAQAAKLFTE